MARKNTTKTNPLFHTITFLLNGIDNYIWIILFVVIALGGAGKWYRMRMTNQEQLAQRVYTEALDEFQRGLAGYDAAWPNIVRLVDVAYERHASSTVAPYLLALKADALVREDKQDEAINTMSTALEKIPTTSPLYFLYKTKQALMMLDSKQEQIKQNGINVLRKLAQNNDNTNNDMARFYLGSYYIAIGDKKTGEPLLVSLMESQEGQESKSPWVEKAEQLLQTIS